jgi:hypothetical protein
MTEHVIDMGRGWVILSADFIASMTQIEKDLKAGPVKMGPAIPLPAPKKPSMRRAKKR